MRDAESKYAGEGDKVVFEILSYPEGHHLGEGVIIEVLGEAGQPDVETQAVIAAYNLPGDFPKACVDQARDAAKSFDDDVELSWTRDLSSALRRLMMSSDSSWIACSGFSPRCASRATTRLY